MIQFHSIFARKHGQSNGYPVIASFSDPLAVLRAYEEIVDPVKGASFRLAHAEVQHIVNLDIVSQHEFPDPAVIEKLRLEGLLVEAKRLKNAALKAAADLKSTRITLDAATAAMKALSPEQKQLLADTEAAEAKAAADAAAAQKKAEDEATAEQERMEAAAKLQTAAAQDAAMDGTTALENAEPMAAELPLNP